MLFRSSRELSLFSGLSTESTVGTRERTLTFTHSDLGDRTCRNCGVSGVDMYPLLPSWDSRTHMRTHRDTNRYAYTHHTHTHGHTHTHKDTNRYAHTHHTHTQSFRPLFYLPLQRGERKRVQIRAESICTLVTRGRGEREKEREGERERERERERRREREKERERRRERSKPLLW